MAWDLTWLSVYLYSQPSNHINTCTPALQGMHSWSPCHKRPHYNIKNFSFMVWEPYLIASPPVFTTVKWQSHLHSCTSRLAILVLIPIIRFDIMTTVTQILLPELSSERWSRCFQDYHSFTHSLTHSLTHLLTCASTPSLTIMETLTNNYLYA